MNDTFFASFKVEALFVLFVDLSDSFNVDTERHFFDGKLDVLGVDEKDMLLL